MILTGAIAAAAMAGSLLGSPQQQACSAAIAYAQHPTPAGLSKAVSGVRAYGRSLLGRPVTRSYLAADALEVLATDYSPSRTAPKYLPRGIGYVAQDCLKVVTVG